MCSIYSIEKGDNIIRRKGIMKKILITTLLAIACLVAFGLPISATSSYGLTVGYPGSYPDSPTKATWMYGYPMYTVRWDDITRDYGLGEGWVVWLGQGIRYSVKLTGDYDTGQIEAVVINPTTLKEGYEAMPLEYVSFDQSIYTINKLTATYVWLRFNLPNTEAFQNKNYQVGIEFRLLQPATPAKNKGQAKKEPTVTAQASACYVFGNTQYIITGDK